MKYYIPAIILALSIGPSWYWAPELITPLTILTSLATLIGWLHQLPLIIRAYKFSRDRAQNARMDNIEANLRNTREWLSDVEDQAIPAHLRNRR